jgi:hypothetical protein
LTSALYHRTATTAYRSLTHDSPGCTDPSLSTIHDLIPRRYGDLHYGGLGSDRSRVVHIVEVQRKTIGKPVTWIHVNMSTSRPSRAPPGVVRGWEYSQVHLLVHSRRRRRCSPMYSYLLRVRLRISEGGGVIALDLEGLLERLALPINMRASRMLRMRTYVYLLSIGLGRPISILMKAYVVCFQIQAICKVSK